MAAFNNVGLTITFGDRAENHKGMQIIGEMASQGYSVEELKHIHVYLTQYNIRSELIDLGAYLPPEYGTENASVLVIRNGVSIFVNPPDLLWQELMALDYDKKAFMYGREVDKKARHNLCFGDFDQDPDYGTGKGRVYSFASLPYLDHIRKYLPMLAGEKATKLQAEANLYYDVRKCGISAHGDGERKIVIGIRLGESFPLVYQWYLRSQPVGLRIDLTLHHGDIYIMSEKASGSDWLRKVIPTLRHAAGCEKYLKMTGPKSRKK